MNWTTDQSRSKNFWLILTLGTFIGLAPGCASKSITSVGLGELPKELPQDMQDKFEVKEAVEATPSPSPVAVPSPSPAPTKKGKQKQKAEAAKSAADQKVSPSPSASPVAKAPIKYPSRRPVKDPIWIGEKLTYEITYFGLAAGDFTLEVLPHKEINGRKVYHVKGTAVSSKVFSLFYRLNDWIETFFDYDGLFSHRFRVVLDESKQTRDSLELYDSEKAQTFYWNKWNHHKKGYTETKNFFPMTPFSQDSLSAMYYLRTLPLIQGQEYVFPVISEGKTWDAVCKVVRKENLETPIGKIRTIVVKPETKYQGILQKRGDSYVWFTDDERRLLVRLEAKVRIGTVVADLKKVEYGEAPKP